MKNYIIGIFVIFHLAYDCMYSARPKLPTVTLRSAILVRIIKLNLEWFEIDDDWTALMPKGFSIDHLTSRSLLPAYINHEQQFVGIVCSLMLIRQLQISNTKHNWPTVCHNKNNFFQPCYIWPIGINSHVSFSQWLFQKIVAAFSCSFFCVM